MKRLTLLSIVCAFFLGALTSCNFLDRKYEYTYGYDRQRVFMEEHANGVERTKRYVGN